MPHQGPAPPTAPLTSRIARGDGAAFAAFYDHWFDRVFAQARRATRRDEAFCLDVVQDVMIKVAKAIPVMQREDSVKAWLSRATWGAAVDRLRSEQRRTRREQEAALLRPPPGEVADPAVAQEHREAVVWLREQLAGLPGSERDLLLARFGDGATLAEVGASFGMSGSAAWGRIRRALQRLRQRGKEWIGE